MNIEERIKRFFVAISKATEENDLCLYSFMFKGVGEDIEMTFIDTKNNKIFDVAMSPKKKTIISRDGVSSQALA
jgi:hypothetical protein